MKSTSTTPNQIQALFPLSKDVLIEVAQPVATAALVTNCTALVLAAQGLDSNTNPLVLVVMNALLFAYLPVACWATSVRGNQDES